MNSFDVIIVGAGLAGINAAYRLQCALPHLTYAILEGRGDLGGTWDLFRYPGIRSDSDLYTYGFAWQPWDQDTPLAEGGAIVAYMRTAAQKYGIDKHIQYQKQVQKASWSSAEQLWTLHVQPPQTNTPTKYHARFVMLCTGYYDHNQGFQTVIPGLESFKGQTVHPQFWPEDIDYANKQVVVIGSGATAITLVPKLAEKAARTTMVQRSPTYILSVPNGGQKASWITSLLPTTWSRAYTRLWFVLWSRFNWVFCQAFPDRARTKLQDDIQRELPPHIPVDPHFKPKYNPWDQRVCMTPNADFFKCLRAGTADVKTGTIREVVAYGVILNNAPDDTIPADIIITATGLKLEIGRSTVIEVDGVTVEPSERYLWHGAMLQDVPNLALVIGYATTSWTLGVDATSHLTCRILQRMDKKKASSATPRAEEGVALTPTRMFPITSTYVTTAEKGLPLAAAQAPWQPRNNYLADYWSAKWGDLDKGLEFH